MIPCTRCDLLLYLLPPATFVRVLQVFSLSTISFFDCVPSFPCPTRPQPYNPSPSPSPLHARSSIWSRKRRASVAQQRQNHPYPAITNSVYLCFPPQTCDGITRLLNPALRRLQLQSSSPQSINPTQWTLDRPGKKRTAPSGPSRCHLEPLCTANPSGRSGSGQRWEDRGKEHCGAVGGATSSHCQGRHKGKCLGERRWRQPRGLAPRDREAHRSPSWQQTAVVAAASQHCLPNLAIGSPRP